MVFWGGAKTVKNVTPLARKPSFHALEGPGIEELSQLFLRLSRGGLPRRVLGDFCEIWVPSGDHLGSIWSLWTVPGAGQFLETFLGISREHGEGEGGVLFMIQKA